MLFPSHVASIPWLFVLGFPPSSQVDSGHPALFQENIPPFGKFITEWATKRELDFCNIVRTFFWLFSCQNGSASVCGYARTVYDRLLTESMRLFCEEVDGWANVAAFLRYGELIVQTDENRLL